LASIATSRSAAAATTAGSHSGRTRPWDQILAQDRPVLEFGGGDLDVGGHLLERIGGFDGGGRRDIHPVAPVLRSTHGVELRSG